MPETFDNLSLLGVIGGVGPQAGLDFVGKIFSNTRAVRDQDHLNCMLISCSSIIPDRTGFLLQDKSEEENPAFGMFESARRLYMAGSRIAAVACNTAHAERIFAPFLGMVKESLPGLRIVNMLETAALFVKESLKIKRLGLLATIGTYESRVYHEYFKAEEGYQLMEPENSGREKIHAAIYSEEFGIKAHSQDIKSQAQILIQTEIESLICQGAGAVILGCTESPLGIRNQSSPVPVIDPTLLTARRMIELTAPEKLLAL
jgi:aspartate racemase